MMSEVPDDLTCDLAETYGIFDKRALPPTLVATLAAGLSAGSRVKRHYLQLPDDSILLGALVDKLNDLLYGLSQDTTSPRPPRILAALVNEDDSSKPQAFESPAAFLAARAKFIAEMGDT